MLRETALPLVGGLIPPLGPAERARLLARALRECLSLGITQVQTDDAGIAGASRRPSALGRCRPEGVPVRITLMLPIDQFDLAHREGIGTGWGDERLRIGT